MSNRCPACLSHNTQETHSLNRECLDCREVFDPTMNNGDMDEDEADATAREEWLPESEVNDTETFPSAEWVEAEFVNDDDDWVDREPDCDDSDDGQALASAGWGTDEDYGYFGGDD